MNDATLAVLIALVLAVLRNGTPRDHVVTRWLLVVAVLILLLFAMDTAP